MDRNPRRLRTPPRVLDSFVAALKPLGPFGAALDLCCGTGAGIRALRELAVEQVTGVDSSADVLAIAQEAHHVQDPSYPPVHWVAGDAGALPFAPSSFDLITSFGALARFLPAERPALFVQVYAALLPGGLFAFPVVRPLPSASRGTYWALRGPGAAMRVRDALGRPALVVHHRSFRLADVRTELAAVGFAVQTAILPELEEQVHASPSRRVVLARRLPRASSTS